MFHRIVPLLLGSLFITLSVARGQDAVSSITQSRLFTAPSAPGTTLVDANGAALPAQEEESPTSSEDESFGAQIIFKNQQRRRYFSVFADASIIHTNNVDLTPSGRRSDTFLAANAGGAWRPSIQPGLVAEVSAGASVFRYDRARELDFEKFSVGGGLSWAVPRAGGIIAFGRYDFAEVLDAGGDELLQDHGFALGLQKIFLFGRSHYVATGLTGIVGFSTPRSQERDQAAIHAAYHLQITRSFDADVLYRYAAQFYSEGNRTDHNHILSLAVGCSVTRWLRLGGLISAARNDSSQAGFDYDVLNLGAALRAEVSF